jgi:hypothetical protein
VVVARLVNRLDAGFRRVSGCLAKAIFAVELGILH